MPCFVIFQHNTQSVCKVYLRASPMLHPYRAMPLFTLPLETHTEGNNGGNRVIYSARDAGNNTSANGRELPLDLTTSPTGGGEIRIRRIIRDHSV